MKYLIFSLLLIFFYVTCAGQIPQGFNYQAIAHDTYGSPITNTSLPVTITIQSDSLGGTIFWEELHPAVVTNDFGLITLVIGKGIEQVASTVNDFKDINWSVSPIFIKTQVFYNSQLLNMGSSRLWSVPYSMTAGNIAGPLKKLEVISNTEQMDEALFEVKNKDGKTVFAVYNEGVRIYVGDGDNTKGAKGGFAIGGYGLTKSEPQDYLIVNRDSVRIYLDNETEKGVKGGFAIGGFGMTKAPDQNYLIVNPDSIRAYIDTNTEKGPKGGFAIGGFGLTKAGNEEYLRVTRDSTRVFLNDTETKGPKGGFAIGGFGTTKNSWNEYLSVTMDSVKVSKSLLIPRLTTEERDNLSFVPGEALIIFNMTEECMQIYKNDVWSNIWCFNCAPAFIIQPVDQTICSGEDAVFFVSATGTSLSYQWQESWDNGITWHIISDGGINPQYSGANQYTFHLYNVPVSYHGYKYRCVAKGSCLPDVTSNSVTLNVGSTPPVITLQPTDQQLSTGCTANFIIESPGYGITYKWQQSTDGGGTWSNISNGGTSPVFAGATTSDLSLSNVPWSCNNYKYRCIVSNLCGADATSNAANLTISPSSITMQPSDQVLTTTCSASFGIATTSGYIVSYQWQASSNGGSSWDNISNGGTAPVYSGVTTTTLSLSNVPLACNNYKYRCIVSSLCGPNETSATANLTISPSSITMQPSDQVLTTTCSASFGIATTSGYVVSYQWQASSNGGSNWDNISNGGTAPVYSGVTTTTLSLSNVPLACNNYKYRCIVSSLCGPNETSASATLEINILPVITVQPADKLVYSGQNITFNITTSGTDYTYQWQESTDGGGTWLNVYNGGSNPVYAGANNDSLDLSNVPLIYDSYKYRCIISHYCRPDAVSDAATLSVPSSDPITDIDGNTYNTVGIGSQLWMAENLKTTKYRNGDLIGTTTPATFDISGEDTPKYQWAYNGNESNVATYGRLYTWGAVTDSRNVCPTGWHVPTNGEFITLTDYLSYNGYGYEGNEIDIAKSLAATSGWTEHTMPGSVGNDQASNNISGFTALPAGMRDISNSFLVMGEYGIWWSSSEYGTNAQCRFLRNVGSFVYNGETNKKQGYSVRCVKD